MRDDRLLTNILIGASIGGFVGYIVGSILADHCAPEYYTEDELRELEVLGSEYNSSSEETLFVRNDPKKFIVGEDKKMVKRAGKINYGAQFEKTHTLEDLAAKYNEGDVSDDSVGDDDDLVEDDLYPEERTPEDEYDLEERDFENPHILTREEYEANETEFKQVILNYYAGDDVLANEKDRPLENAEKVVGEEALLNFGVFSDDPDVVYVCNPRLKGEYQIIRNPGSYDDIVIGKPEPKSKKKEVETHNVFEDAELKAAAMEEEKEEDDES